MKILLHKPPMRRVQVLTQQLKLKTQLMTVHRHRQTLLTQNSLPLKMLQAQAPLLKTEIRQLLNRQQNKIKLICIEKHYIL